MLKHTLYFCIALLFHCMASTQTHAQVLMVRSGEVRLSAVYFLSQYDHVRDLDGQRQQINTIRYSGIDLKADIGLHKRWNLLLRAPIVFNSLKANTAYIAAWRRDTLPVASDVSVNKLGDVEGGLRFGFLEREHVEAGFSVLHGLGTGYRADFPYLNTGYGDYNTRILFDACYQSDPRWYAQVNMGFNNHTSGFSDEFLAMALLHAELSKSLRGELFWKGQYNFENGDMIPGSFYSGLYQNGSAWMMAGGDLVYETPYGFGLNAGCSVPLRGQLIVAAPVFRFGINALLTKKPVKTAPNPDEKSMK